MTNLTINSQRRALIQKGHAVAGLTDADIEQAYNAMTLGAALGNTPKPIQPQPSDTSSAPQNSTVGADLANTFMNDGKNAFIASLGVVLGDYQKENDNLTSIIDGLHADNSALQDDVDNARRISTTPPQIITRTVDIDGNEITPDVNPQKVDTVQAADIWPDIDGAYTFDRYDFEAPREPAFYDMNQMHNSGLLAQVASAVKRDNPLWLYGEKGTGKTTFVQSLAFSLGRPFFRISHTKSMESQALIGCFLLPDSKTQWSDGALTQAIKTPRAVILLDEPTRNPDACEIYQTLLDEKYYDIAETGERVWIADGVSFFAADNQNGDGDDTGRYDGTFAVNSAFGDRFKAKLQCFYMAPAHEAALLVSLTGINKNSALEIAEFANIMRGMATAGEIEEPISFRRLNALAEFIVDGIPHDLAMETAVFAFIRHEQDRETYRTQAAVHLTQLRA